MRRWLAIALVVLPGCSIQQSAMRRMGGALAGVADQFARDEDPELVRSAIPVSLKMMEAVLDGDKKNPQLLAGLCKGFSQYAYGFVLQDADEMDDKDKLAAKALRDRAAKLFLRARGYGILYFEIKRPTFLAELKLDPKKAAQTLRKPICQ